MTRVIESEGMACRAGCGACCTAPSITTPIPGRDGRPAGPKAAGERCHWLDERLRCELFGQPQRPAVCVSLRPDEQMCGRSQADALRWLARLERATRPGRDR